MHHKILSRPSSQNVPLKFIWLVVSASKQEIEYNLIKHINSKTYASILYPNPMSLYQRNITTQFTDPFNNYI